MSTHPQEQQPADDGRAPVTLPRLAEMKANGEPIVMVTAYDYPSALVAEEAGVDIVLVGDTARWSCSATTRRPRSAWTRWSPWPPRFDEACVRRF